MIYKFKNILLCISSNIDDPELKQYIEEHIDNLSDKLGEFVTILNNLMEIVNSNEITTVKIEKIQNLLNISYVSAGIVNRVAKRINNLLLTQLGGGPKRKKKNSKKMRKLREQEAYEKKNQSITKPGFTEDQKAKIRNLGKTSMESPKSDIVEYESSESTHNKHDDCSHIPTDWKCPEDFTKTEKMKLLKVYHPDKNPFCKSLSTKITQEINNCSVESHQEESSKEGIHIEQSNDYQLAHYEEPSHQEDSDEPEQEKDSDEPIQEEDSDEPEPHQEQEEDSDEQENFLTKLYNMMPTFIPRDLNKFNIAEWPIFKNKDYGIRKNILWNKDHRPDNADIEPLNTGYIILLLLSSLPIVSPISNFILICKSLQEDRFFLATLITINSVLNFLTPSFISPITRPGNILKLLYVLDNFSYMSFRKDDHTLYIEDIINAVKSDLEKQEAKKTKLSIEEIREKIKFFKAND